MKIAARVIANADNTMIGILAFPPALYFRFPSEKDLRLFKCYRIGIPSHIHVIQGIAGKIHQLRLQGLALCVEIEI